MIKEILIRGIFPFALAMLLLAFLVWASGCTHNRSMLYYDQYIRTATTQTLLIDRSGPLLKQGWGFESRYDLPYELEFNFDFSILASVVSFQDPPEEVHWGVEMGREFWDTLYLGMRHYRMHNVSRADTGSFKGYGVAGTSLRIGWVFQ